MDNPELQEAADGLGMAGRFPRARDLDEFWRNLRDGVESISSFTEEMVGEVTMEYSLSHGQRALWFLQQLAPESVAHNVVHALRIRTEVDMAALRRSFQRLVDRHAALRTTFTERNGEPVQQVHKHVKVCFQAENASNWSMTRLEDRLAQEMFRPFDLERGPLMRVIVFTRSPQDHLVLLAMHHIVTDMWSIAIIMYEVFQIYQAEVTGEPVTLRPPRAEYADYVRRQAEMLASPEGEQHWAYWRKQLAGELPMLDLPTARPRPAVQTDRGSAATLRFGVELTEALKDLSKAHGTALYVMALAAFQVLLHRYTGQDDLLVGFPKAGRTRRMVRTIGYFINPVPLRADFSGNPPFSGFLEQVRETVEGASEHDIYPFPLLVERLQPDRELSRSPVFQVIFSWQKTTRLVDSRHMGSFALGREGEGMRIGGLPLEPVSLPRRVTPFDMTMLMAEAEDELVATLEYNTDLFDAATVERMLGHFKTLLEGIVANPDRPVSELPLLTEVERRRLLIDWNDTAARYPQDRCVHELFEAQVERTPDVDAVLFEDRRLTYRELNRRANQLAHYLQKLGVGPEVLVGISVERSPEMVVGLLGILKAGGAYLPLDPAYPQERLAFMLEDAQVSVLLTQEHLLDGLPIGEAANRRISESARLRPGSASKPQSSRQQVTQHALRTIVCLDSDWDAIAEEPQTNPQSDVTPENLAYVIYTSGSTGRPKGTLLQHRGLCNFIQAYVQELGVGTDSRVLQFASYSFDASLAEIFTALLGGATLYLARREVLLSPSHLTQLLRDQVITTAILPPSILSSLPAEDLPALQALVSAGEACSPGIAARWAPGRRFFNGYGPTEATVGPTLYPVGDVSEDTTNVPIGHPIANVQIYLLDTYLQPVPVGVPGELHISGVGLARGYLDRPGLTARKFVPNPFSDKPGARLYKSGDLARYRRDGTIEFLGRIDHQVKVRGFRIELGEIEAALGRHSGVQDGVVTVREEVPGDKRLVAYLVPAEPAPSEVEGEAGLAAGELCSFLRQTLPEYMVPSAFVTLEALPLSPSGKVDREALPAPERDRPELERVYVAPRDEIERKVAAIWREVLDIDKVGIHDNFFDLGGHSLMVAKVHNRLQEIAQRELSMVELFRYPTIGALAEYMTEEPRDRLSSQRSQERAQRQRAAMMRQRRLRQGISRGR